MKTIISNMVKFTLFVIVKIPSYLKNFSAFKFPYKFSI